MRTLIATCRHPVWLLTDSPPDVPGRWYRCKHCRIFGYKKNRKVLAYKCTHRGCGRAAVDRLPGRGARMNILWRCGPCMGAAVAKQQPEAA